MLMTVNIITAKLAKKMIDNRKFGLIIDLRDYDEYLQGHLPGAINIPVNQVLDRINEIRGYEGSNVLLYCEHGIQSIGTGKALILNGFSRVYSLDKGLGSYNYPLYN
ncbi:MAG: rhodanese-like domain-containing protein [Intestinibacter sp.]|uniref:rhodanese-like domain-containing protein n=1 Tax=Intestinibacter sp. TaxID=1965304 RepID=UPI003F14AB44